MTNPIELLISLGIDSDASRSNIKTYLNNLKLDSLDVTLNVKGSSETNKTFSQMEKQVEQLQKQVQSLSQSLGKVGAGSLSSSFNNEVAESKKSLVALEEYVRSMNGRTKVELVGKGEEERVKSVIATFKDELGRLQKVTYSPIFEDDKSTIKSFEQVRRAVNDTNFEEFNKKSIDVTKQLKELGLQGKLSADSFYVLEKELQRAFTTTELDKVVTKMKELSKQDIRSDKWENALFNVKTQAQELVKTLDKIEQNTQVNVDTSQFNKLKNEIQSIANTEIKTDEDIKRINSEFSRLSETVTKVKNESNQFDSAFSKINDTVLSISKTGIIADNSLREVVSKIHKINSLDITLDEKIVMLRREIDKLNLEFSEEKHIKKMRDAMTKAALDVQDLHSALERTEKTYKRTVQTMDTKPIKAELASLNNIPNFTKQTDIDEFNKKINAAKTNLKTFNASVSETARGSLTIVDAFKVAMERFPIWMAASTAFYGSVRTAREFMRIIVDIDTKLTSIAKVISDDMDIDTIFNQATVSAETFARSISEALDAYTEFARQGFKGQDLGLLADAGLVTSNVGELNSAQASEFLTSSIIQWNKETSEAMSIIDSWNAISNNYATTVEKLARGQSRAGATAKAVGLEFNQLNAIIGTVTAATKQSGDEVGNFVKNVLPRLVSDKGQSTLSGLGISLTDESGNLRDVIEVYTEVAEKVKGISDTERIAVTEGLAG